KGLKMTSFNEDYAMVLGISAGLWNLSLMSMVSLATVVSFESVGAILVVALLVAPAASAYLLVQKLKPLLILSAVYGLLGALGGYGLSKLIETSIAGSITTVLGILFLFSLVIQITIKTKKTVHALES
ncbi:MAG: iron chelate uptake ABC transporter family permease subunit, partial [Bacteroidota bacterium]|nr:iron chelate uptake ABC transporter family permease subunit [Bacteroidota bacterium]